MATITAYILAYNNESKIEACVRSVHWADEVLVVDSHSEDRTVEIAESLGARVVQVDFRGFGHLRNDAIAHCTHDWVFSLDSDERCTEAARDEILRIIDDPNAQDIYFVPRRNLFFGKEIRHSGWYPNYRQPQLFRKKAMRYTLASVHEGWESLNEKPVGHLKSAIWQIPFEDLEESIAKWNRYSTLGTDKIRAKGKRPSMTAALTRAVWSFLKHYLVKRGFLDGWAGFLIALGYFEQTFYRYAKHVEAEHGRRTDASAGTNLPGQIK